MASNEQYFAAIILAIIATSTLIGLVNLAYNDKFPDLSNPTGTISGQASFYGTSFAKFATTGILIQGQNFTSTSGYDTNISILKGGTWAQSPSGYQLISDDFLTDPLIVLRNVLPSGNVYTVSYTINNIPNTDFYITPRHWVGSTISDIRLEFKLDGIYIPKYPLTAGFIFNGYDYVYPLPDAQKTIAGGSTIVTELTDISGPGTTDITAGKNSLLSVTKDGVLLFSVYVRDMISKITSTDQLQYAGVGSHTPGFTVISIDAPIQYTPNTVTLVGSKNEDIIASTIGLINLVVSFFSGISLFLSNLGSILGYAISSDICPLWATAIVMTPQFSGLILIIVKILRGTS